MAGASAVGRMENPMNRLTLATVAAAVLVLPTIVQAQSPTPNSTPEQKKAQAQRDWQPQQQAERPAAHQGEEQKFGAGKDSTVGQTPSSASETAKPIPEHEIKPPQSNVGK
jgi:hypothetical protein